MDDGKLLTLFEPMANFNEPIPWWWHIKATFQGLIDLSVEVFKALILINGGAAIPVLAYLSNFAAHSGIRSRPNMTRPLLWFAGGVLAAAVAFIIAYFVQLRLYVETRAAHQDTKKIELHAIGIAIAGILVLLSACAFGVGCWMAVR